MDELGERQRGGGGGGGGGVVGGGERRSRVESGGDRGKRHFDSLLLQAKSLTMEWNQSPKDGCTLQTFVPVTNTYTYTHTHTHSHRNRATSSLPLTHLFSHTRTKYKSLWEFYETERDSGNYKYLYSFFFFLFFFFLKLVLCFRTLGANSCLLYMHNLYMYICIRLLSIVGTGILTCSIIVLYSLY